ncbi:hypothetical protein HUT16_21540 [Kitasatospora sp. NA04385]|uniref:hypothetical protein n=1 Tax=Kitasatospora sp. NA04385 TaxID=2742135 RepID=UPI001590A9D7|nr:hypothetical protein [Kitasatospora sp. NA04385]QKW21297.1 hypothetical protein HUT16_21540 [Kitasatospora sp. NA04385]
MGITTTESTSKFAALARQAALSVAVAAAVGGAVFAPAAAAQAAEAGTVSAGHATPNGCGECYPDVI